MELDICSTSTGFSRCKKGKLLSTRVYFAQYMYEYDTGLLRLLGTLLELQSFWEEFDCNNKPVNSRFRRVNILYSKQTNEDSDQDIWYFVVMFDTVTKLRNAKNTLKFNYLAPTKSDSPNDPYVVTPKACSLKELIVDFNERIAKGDLMLPYTLALDILSSLGLIDHNGCGDVCEWVSDPFKYNQVDNNLARPSASQSRQNT